MAFYYRKPFELKDDAVGIVLLIVGALVFLSLTGCRGGAQIRKKERKEMWREVELAWQKMEYQLVTRPCTDGWWIAHNARKQLEAEVFKNAR